MYTFLNSVRCQKSKEPPLNQPELKNIYCKSLLLLLPLGGL